MDSDESVLTFLERSSCSSFQPDGGLQFPVTQNLFLALHCWFAVTLLDSERHEGK